MPNRKGQYSCDLCRSRKLRCDRPLPCGNCVSRGKTCNFLPDPTATGPKQKQRQRRRAQVTDVTSASPASDQAPVAASPRQLHTTRPTTAGNGQDESLLAEIKALRKLAEDLEKRVTTSNISNNEGDAPVRPASGSPAVDTDVTILDTNQSPSSVEKVGEVVAHLERVSMDQTRPHNNPINHGEDLVLKVNHIRAIPRESKYVVRTPDVVPCIWLPQHHEAHAIVDTYMRNLSYIHHIVHHPSVPGFVDEVYHQIRQHGRVNPGHLFLLLSMIATTTYSWTAEDGVGFEDSLFTSVPEATGQVNMWIKAAYDVLNSGTNGPPLALETAQGTCILGLLICNLEGVSLRYRCLVSTGLFLCRQLGLHRLDCEVNDNTNTIRTEVGRRVWWFLAATDWLSAARYGDGTYHSIPCQMSVHRPRNINDADLADHGANTALPLSQPTEMSYFLQRISLADIARRMVDRQQENANRPVESCASKTYAQVMTIDAELDQLVHDLPSFLHIENHVNNPDTDSNIFIQAYFINSNLNIQRCKLHLGYLASKPSESLAYVYSRDACLKAARRLVRAEMQLERSQHVFARMRLRLTGILFGVFMAGIVLLMDACVNGSAQDEIRRDGMGEAAEALRIIEDARGQSVAAANLYQSLMQVLDMFRAQKEQQQQRQEGQHHVSSGVREAPDMNASGCQQASPMSHSATPIGTRAAWYSDEFPVDSQLFRSLEELTDFDGFQWDDLFSGIDASSLF